MSNDFDIEDVLRASLAEHARQAPSGAPLAERIIAEADHPRPVPTRHDARWWRGWTLPAVAAGSVAALVVAIGAIAQWNDHRQTHAASRPTASPSSLFATGDTSASVATTRVASTVPAGLAVSPLSGFRVVDLTFVSADEGWALGTARCAQNSSSRCAEVMHTQDGGQQWDRVSSPGVSVAPGQDCTALCIQDIRFDPGRQVGYAYGPDVLYMTTDGGAAWQQQSGGATSLEVANQTVMRVNGNRLEMADVGTTSWRPAALPGDGAVSGPVLRALSQAYVPAASGGFYGSTDDGANWNQQPNPCPGGAKIHSMTAAADGSVVVACTASTSEQPVLLTSSDNGQTFDTWQSPPAADATIAATDASTVFVVSGNKLYRGTGSGKSWQVVASDSSAGPASFLGFENLTTGRWVSGDGSVVWTTTDAGQNWTACRFS